MADGFCFLSSLLLDHQKLEREARICRLLKHPNIGKHLRSGLFLGQLGEGRENRDPLLLCLKPVLSLDLCLV